MSEEPKKKKGWAKKIDKEKELARFKAINKRVKESQHISEESLNMMMTV